MGEGLAGLCFEYVISASQ